MIIITTKDIEVVRYQVKEQNHIFDNINLGFFQQIWRQEPERVVVFMSRQIYDNNNKKRY